MTLSTYLNGIYRILFFIIISIILGCNNKIEIIKGGDFTVSVLPYHTVIHSGEIVQLNFTIKTQSSYMYTTYNMRYFQVHGSATLSMDDGRILQENQIYILPRKNFTINVKATTESEHSITFYFSDSLENTHTLTISLSNQ